MSQALSLVSTQTAHVCRCSVSRRKFSNGGLCHRIVVSVGDITGSEVRPTEVPEVIHQLWESPPPVIYRRHGFNQHRERKLARSSPRGTVPILPSTSVIETISEHPTASPYQLSLGATDLCMQSDMISDHNSQSYVTWRFPHRYGLWSILYHLLTQNAHLSMHATN